MVSRYIEVEVSLDRFDTEELEEELETRRGGKDNVSPLTDVPPLGGEQQHPIHEIYYAMKFGLDEKAHDLMRAYINDQLGTAL